MAAVNPQNGYTPLHAAARRGEPSLVKLLIEYGCPLDARANHGETAFLISCQVSCQRLSGRIMVFTQVPCIISRISNIPYG